MRFLRSQRLVGQKSFRRVFRSGRRRGAAGLVVIAAPGPGPRPRLGISAARRQIRRAVDRNRLRRLVRESFRQAQDRLQGLDVVVVVRAPCLGCDRRAISRTLDKLWNGLSPCDPS